MWMGLPVRCASVRPDQADHIRTTPADGSRYTAHAGAETPAGAGIRGYTRSRKRWQAAPCSTSEQEPLVTTSMLPGIEATGPPVMPRVETNMPTQFDPLKAAREELAGLGDIHRVLLRRERKAEEAMSEAENELNAIRKLIGYVQIGQNQLKERIKELE